jgi:hypothetical protein
MNILEAVGAGNLISPKAERSTVLNYWALDNGRYISFLQRARGEKDTWSFDDWYNMVLWASHVKPLRRLKFPSTKPQWGVVPDIVGDPKGTREEFYRYKDYLVEAGIPLAYAVQDGAKPSDVPSGVEVVFVGGSKNWKWDTAEMWCKEFPRVHIGAVNSLDGFILSAQYGAESVDGSKITRNARQKKDFIDFLTGRTSINLFSELKGFHRDVYREAMEAFSSGGVYGRAKRHGIGEGSNVTLGGLFSI